MSSGPHNLKDEETTQLLLSVSRFIEMFACFSCTLTFNDEELLSSCLDLLLIMLKQSQNNRWTVASNKGLVYLMKLSKKVSGPLYTKIWTCICVLLGDICKITKEDNYAESFEKFSNQISPNILADTLRSIKKKSSKATCSRTIPCVGTACAQLNVETFSKDKSKSTTKLEKSLEKLVSEDDEDIVYLKGNVLNIGNNAGSDLTHEFRQARKLTEVSTSTIVKIAISMLNSGQGGCIYFGIKENGVIKGINCNRKMRNSVRVSVDEKFNNMITPTISHSMYDVRFFPVVLNKKHLKEPVNLNHNLCVITITLRPRLGLYFLKDHSCYCRIGNETKLASSQQIREKAAHIKEEICLAEIECLKQEIASYESKLSSAS